MNDVSVSPAIARSIAILADEYDPGCLVQIRPANLVPYGSPGYPFDSIPADASIVMEYPSTAMELVALDESGVVVWTNVDATVDELNRMVRNGNADGVH